MKGLQNATDDLVSRRVLWDLDMCFEHVAYEQVLRPGNRRVVQTAGRITARRLDGKMQEVVGPDFSRFTSCLNHKVLQKSAHCARYKAIKLSIDLQPVASACRWWWVARRVRRVSSARHTLAPTITAASALSPVFFSFYDYNRHTRYIQRFAMDTHSLYCNASISSLLCSV